jgi:hypothetical protein|tara:strand:- start:6 stop:218 length:213 start_codon:yes stop_codon:yes gene_type:complete
MKSFYRSLLLLVNNEEQMTRVTSYASHRIQILRNQLETQKDRDRVLEIQGAIAELRRFSTLRDEVIKESE